MKKITKQDTATPNTGKDKELIKQERIELQQLIIGLTDARTGERFTDTALDRENLKIQLRNEQWVSIKDVRDFISDAVEDYLEMFPNSNPFFELMFKLKGWTDKNPREYIKPAPCAEYIKRYIYGRFTPDMLPTLLKLVNPLISGHIRKYKLSQFLNAEGKEKMKGFIEDANTLMKECTTWYEFELKYTKKYNLPVQLKFMD